jgi:hypothetical protein
MRKMKSTIRLSLLCLIAWLDGLMLIVYDNCEVEDVEPKAIDYITLDREMLEDTLLNQED